MPTNFPGPIPVPAKTPYPKEQAYGNIWGDLGKIVGQAGQEVQDVQQYTDQAKSREAKMQDMIERRKAALAVQAAREDYQRKQMEFNKAKEDQDISESKRGYDRGVKEHDAVQKRIQGEADKKDKLAKEVRDNVADLNKALEAERIRTGKPLPRQRVMEIARGFPLAGDWKKYAIDRPFKPSTAGTTRKLKKEQYQKLLPKLNRQLESLVADMNKSLSTTFTRSQLVQSMRGMDTRIEEVPDERGTRTYLRQKQEIIRKKIEEIDKVKSFLETSEGEGSAVDDIDTYQEAFEANQAVKKLLEENPE